jgi:uncharacterized membrane protein YidH (DUF202 family)
MSLGAGVIVISLVLLVAAWLMFDRGNLQSRRDKLLCWLKSTLLLGVALTVWSIYKEPSVNFLLLAALSFAFSALLNLLRSQWVFMLP